MKLKNFPNQKNIIFLGEMVVKQICSWIFIPLQLAVIIGNKFFFVPPRIFYLKDISIRLVFDAY